MGNIRQYESSKAAEGLHPTDMGEQAWSSAAYREGRFFHQAGESLATGTRQLGDAIEQHDTMADISKGSADMAGLMDGLQQSWNETAKNADPNDADTAQKWREKVLEPTLQKFGDGFTTKQSQMWAMEQQDHLRQHFFEKTAADQSTLAGDALSQNLSQIQSHLSNVARQDPTSLDTVLGMVDLSVTAMVKNSPNLTADQASKAKTDITESIKKEVAQSAIVGAADKNPDAARQLLNSPSITEHLDGTQVKTLNGYIDEQQRSSLSAQREQEAEMKRQNRESVEDYQNKIVGQTIQADGSVRLYPNFFKDVTMMTMMPDAGDLPKTMLEWGHTVQENAAKGTPAVTDPNVYGDFLSRANLSPSDPHALTLQEVYNAGATNMLSSKDFSMFRGWVAEAGRNPQRVANQKVLNQFFNGMKQYITKSNMLTNDAYGNQKFMEFQQTMQERFDAGIAGGKNALQLTSPGSADYIGKDLTRWQVPPDLSMKATLDKAQGNLAPLPPTMSAPKVKWQPGMSMSDLDKQLSGGK